MIVVGAPDVVAVAVVDAFGGGKTPVVRDAWGRCVLPFSQVGELPLRTLPLAVVVWSPFPRSVFFVLRLPCALPPLGEGGGLWLPVVVG